MVRKRTINKALDMIKVERKEYLKMAESPEGCLDILEKYLPLLKGSLRVYRDHLLSSVDEKFFSHVDPLMQKEPEKYWLHIQEYNNLFKVYGVSERIKESLKLRKSSEIDAWRENEESSEDKEHSDLELTLLECSGVGK